MANLGLRGELIPPPESRGTFMYYLLIAPKIGTPVWSNILKHLIFTTGFPVIFKPNRGDMNG